VRALAVAALAVAVVLALAWTFQRRLVYLPAGAPPPVEQVLPGASSVTLATSDGLELAAWYLEAGPTTVVVLPGNAGNRALRAPLARALADEGLSVLLVDYRGYGGNPGRPSEQGLRRDAEAAAAWVRAHTDTTTLVVYGESLGSGPAVWLASRGRPDALVLRSPLPSLVAVARRHYGPVPRLLLRDRFEVAELIATVDVPTLVVVGEDDRIVPPELSRRVHEAAAGPSRLVVVGGADHNDASLLDGDVLIGAIVELVGGLDGAEGP
jgi:uncharacterized protein